MSFKNMFFLGSSGIALVSSNVPWFFLSGPEEKESTPVGGDDSTVTPEVHREDLSEKTIRMDSVSETNMGINSTREVNNLDPEDAIERPEEFKRREKYPNKTINFQANNVSIDSEGNRGRKNYLYVPYETIGVLSLPFGAKEEDYSRVGRAEVKIKLFSRSAWNSDSHEDEYGLNLEESKINELFEGLDEYKTKQLLLSLSVRREWKNFNPSDTTTFWSGQTMIRPTKIEDLKDLKIKYFDEFEQLKKYVRTKVPTCVNSDRAYYGRIEELVAHDHDRKSFFGVS